jgi:pimeloyl-ACP methyl ester carboxylesterase
VLIHGVGSQWQVWEPVLEAVSRERDVIAVDLPGFGRSPMPAADLPRDMPRLVGDIAAFFKTLGLDRPHVAGNSLGGAIALELAATGHAASATALSPAGFCTPAQLRWAVNVLRLHRYAAHLPEPVMRRLLRVELLRAMSFGMLLGRPRSISAEAALADSLALRSARAFDSVARAGLRYTFQGAPTVPVTVAWGTRDRILSYRQAALARRLLPEARHVDLDGCGHVPMHDDPELVTSVILATTGASV